MEENVGDVEADSGNITTDIESDDESQSCNSGKFKDQPKNKSLEQDEVSSGDCLESSRESSEDKSESTSSYVEGGTTSCSSEGDIISKKFVNESEAIDISMISITPKIDSFEPTEPSEDINRIPQNDQCLVENQQSASRNLTHHNQSIAIQEDISSNIQLPMSALSESINRKSPCSPTQVHCNPPDRPETPKKEVTTRPEIKPRLAPPEPPPRKFINNRPPPLNFGLHQPIQLPQLHELVTHGTREFYVQCQEIEKPKVPERPSVRRDLKKIDAIPEVHARDEKPFAEIKQKMDSIDTYSDFVERSRDFIDEPGTPQPATPFLDPYGYTQIPEPNSREDQLNQVSSNIEVQQQKLRQQHLQPQHKRERSSPSIEQQHFQLSHPQHKRERSSPTIDAADGACHSRQNSSSTTDSKQKSLEKEKGVVNRAMMVARSMGLHGHSTKSTNSPKSPRKRSAFLASEFYQNIENL